jgi:hypothetical protein
MSVPFNVPTQNVVPTVPQINPETPGLPSVPGTAEAQSSAAWAAAMAAATSPISPVVPEPLLAAPTPIVPLTPLPPTPSAPPSPPGPPVTAFPTTPPPPTPTQLPSQPPTQPVVPPAPSATAAPSVSSTVKNIFQAYQAYYSTDEVAHREAANVTDQDKTTCFFVGKASNQMASRDLLSYCFPLPPSPGVAARCLRVCFSITELVDLIEAEGPVPAPFPFKTQIEAYARSFQLPLVVSATFSDDFIVIIKHKQQSRAAERGSGEEPMVAVVMTSLIKYLESTPDAMKQGSFLTTVTSWGKWLVSTALKAGVKFLRMMRWVWQNPFWSSVVLMVSKLLRMLICAWLSGVGKEDMVLLLDRILASYHDNLFMTVIISLFKIVYSCVADVISDIAKYGVLGIFPAILSCLGDSFKVVQVATQSVWRYISNFFLYAFTWFMDSFGMKTVGDALARLFICFGEHDALLRCIKSFIWDDPEFTKELSVTSAIMKHIFMDWNLVVFFAIMAMVPTALLEKVLDMVGDYFSAGQYSVIMKKIKDQLFHYTKYVSKQPPSVLSFVQWLYYGPASMVYLYKSFINEMYAWFVDVLGCLLRKLTFQLGLTTTMDPACCFQAVVDDLLSVFATEKVKREELAAQEAAEKAAVEAREAAAAAAAEAKRVAAEEWAKKSWYEAVTSSISSLGSKISDVRLKHLVFREPILDVVWHDQEGRTLKIPLYLFRWKPHVREHYPHLSAGLQVGVIAQEIMNIWPQAIHFCDGYMCIKRAAIPAELQQALSYFESDPFASADPFEVFDEGNWPRDWALQPDSFLKHRVLHVPAFTVAFQDGARRRHVHLYFYRWKPQARQIHKHLPQGLQVGPLVTDIQDLWPAAVDNRRCLVFHDALPMELQAALAIFADDSRVSR